MPSKNIYSLLDKKNENQTDREVIIFAPNIYGRKGLVSLIENQEGVKLKPIIVQDPQEIIAACNERTTLIIYQLFEGAMLTGTIRCIVEVSAYWPDIFQVVSSDKLTGIFQYISSMLKSVKLWEPMLPVSYLSDLLKKALDACCLLPGQQHKNKTFQSNPNDVFTGRQRNIFQLQAKGLDVPEIARRLHMLPQTVRSHRYQAFRRLGVGNSVDQQLLNQILEELVALSAIGFSSPMETVAVMEALTTASHNDYPPLPSMAQG
ncbi:helix-turn-helix domain-containing protein [Dryocola sp. BD626]|uniref:helix-turn-helix domain-containing protein n=1 Tax=Dryocola sp. BD626 TaxID=3133273 RepID=UPI003F4FDF4B